MEEIDVGDKVVVLDNSYAIKITEEGLEDGIPGGVRRKISPLYEVIATNKILPAYLDEVDKLILTIEEINNIKNDTIIQSPKGKSYIINSKYLAKYDSKEYYNYMKNFISQLDKEISVKNLLLQKVNALNVDFLNL